MHPAMRTAMDADRFDDLLRALTNTRRSLIGASLFVVLGWAGLPTAEAKKHGGHKQGGNGWRHHRAKKAKQTICHCGNGDPASCKTINPRPQSARKHLKHQCDY